METSCPQLLPRSPQRHSYPKPIICSRETAGVSLLIHAAFAAGVAFWFTLGVMLWNWPMMTANALTFALTIICITDKARALPGLPDRNQERVAIY